LTLRNTEIKASDCPAPTESHVTLTEPKRTFGIPVALELVQLVAGLPSYAMTHNFAKEQGSVGPKMLQRTANLADIRHGPNRVN
jgi:hypothetical protein